VSDKEVLMINNMYPPSGNIPKNNNFFTELRGVIDNNRSMIDKGGQIITMDIGDANCTLNRQDKVGPNVYNGMGQGMLDYMQSTNKVDAMEHHRIQSGKSRVNSSPTL